MYVDVDTILMKDIVYFLSHYNHYNYYILFEVMKYLDFDSSKLYLLADWWLHGYLSKL